MSLTATTMVVRSEELLSAKAGDGLVLLSLKSEKYYAFDEVTLAVWQALESPVAIGDLCARLQAEFEVEPGECLNDVTQLLDDLATRGLVTILT